MRGIAAGRGADTPVDRPVIGEPNLPRPGRPGSADTQANGHANEGADPATDYASEDQRIAEVFRRIQVLSEDHRFFHLSADDWNRRTNILDWYRQEGFLRDLADGRLDGFTAALNNQEHDDLWKHISDSSSQAATALNARLLPHYKPKIRLTVPPRYEPSGK
ncbi:MAG: hypothetical protein Q9226_005038 [Calogaya cf. arnoldii]